MNNDKITLSREELYELVWKEPMLTLAKKYDISDVGLRKICKRMNIPLPPSGHWQKIKHGKKSPKLPLPKDYTGDSKYVFEKRKEGNEFRHGPPSPSSVRQQEIESSLKNVLIVPEKLNNPGKLIIDTGEDLLKRKADGWLNNGMIHSWSLLDITVTPGNIGRALRFLDTLIKSMAFRGHRIFLNSNKTYVEVYGEKMDVSFRERLKKEIVPGKYGNETKYHPTGLLCFKMNGYRGKE